jgi:hypothetical protein
MMGVKRGRQGKEGQKRGSKDGRNDKERSKEGQVRRKEGRL